MKISNATPFVLVFLISAVLSVSPLVAQDGTRGEDEKPRWAFTGELSLVDTGGNSETSTVGLGVKATRAAQGGGKLELTAGGLRVESTTTSRFAVGSPDAFEIVERSTTETTAENYHLKGRYDRPVSTRLFWFLGAGLERNEFAGFDSRTNVAAGVGHLWFEDDRKHLRTDYSVTYTRQDDLVDDPATPDGFLGLRLGYDYRRGLSATSAFESVLVLDANADETEDLRADLSHAVSVSINERMALKVGLQLLFDNLPSRVQVPLVDAAGTPTGDFVTAELDDLDSMLTVTLVLER
ncbi:MAG: DUF481 domain-containing protein [Thermoanaerobaculia bacterium]